jgi:hypothetical protein
MDGAETAGDGGAAGSPASAPEGETGLQRPPRRRRRRRPRSEGGAGAPGTSPRESGAGGADHPQRGARPQRHGGGGNRDRAQGGAAGPAAARGNDRGSDQCGRGDQRRDGGNRRDGAGRGGGGSRRDAPPRKIERKLYSIDAVVDRGFEDVEDAEGGETRRVNWTIVKRTTADQISRKPLSAVYVLQRDAGSDSGGGEDSEFPSLGAARDAVHKTIVHPEKLTRSKAEHAAEKAGKK